MCKHYLLLLTFILFFSFLIFPYTQAKVAVGAYKIDGMVM